MRDVVLEGPGKNAMGTRLMGGLIEALGRAGGEPLLLTGAGDALSAGLDLKEIAGLDRAGMAHFLGVLEDLITALYEYPGPTAVAVNGHAIAGGCVVTLCCDVRVMTSATKPRIGLNEVALGLRFPPRTWRLVRDRVPRQHQERVLLGGELFDSARARDLGLVDETADDPMGVARERLAALARSPAEAYGEIKRRLRAGVLTPSAEEARRFESDDLELWAGPALKQQIRALLQR